MIDQPEKTARLLAALKEAVPFDVELSERLLKHLRAQGDAVASETRCTVSNVSYAGDEGGIMCHTLQSKEGPALVISLTQLCVPHTMPLAGAIARYQKHRVKKLKKQGGT